MLCMLLYMISKKFFLFENNIIFFLQLVWYLNSYAEICIVAYTIKYDTESTLKQILNIPTYFYRVARPRLLFVGAEMKEVILHVIGKEKGVENRLIFTGFSMGAHYAAYTAKLVNDDLSVKIAMLFGMSIILLVLIN